MLQGGSLTRRAFDIVYGGWGFRSIVWHVNTFFRVRELVEAMIPGGCET